MEDPKYWTRIPWDQSEPLPVARFRPTFSRPTRSLHDLEEQLWRSERNMNRSLSLNLRQLKRSLTEFVRAAWSIEFGNSVFSPHGFKTTVLDSTICRVLHLSVEVVWTTKTESTVRSNIFGISSCAYGPTLWLVPASG